MEDWYEKEQLHFAVQEDNFEEAKRIISEGANINHFDEIGFTPLHYAVQKENFKMAQLLLEEGADINAHNEAEAGNTPLREVAQECSYKMAKFLIEHGADPTIRGWMQINAIDKAKNRKSPEGKRVYELLCNYLK